MIIHLILTQSDFVAGGKFQQLFRFVYYVKVNVSEKTNFRKFEILVSNIPFINEVL